MHHHRVAPAQRARRSSRARARQAFTEYHWVSPSSHCRSCAGSGAGVLATRKLATGTPPASRRVTSPPSQPGQGHEGLVHRCISWCRAGLVDVRPSLGTGAPTAAGGRTASAVERRPRQGRLWTASGPWTPTSGRAPRPCAHRRRTPASSARTGATTSSSATDGDRRAQPAVGRPRPRPGGRRDQQPAQQRRAARPATTPPSSRSTGHREPAARPECRGSATCR